MKSHIATDGTISFTADPTDLSQAAGYAPADIAGGTPLLIGAGAPLTQTMYVTEKGDTSAVSVDDINQGQIGDCYFLSSIGEALLTAPSFIASMIKVNTNGTDTVAFHTAANGSLVSWGTTAFKTITETVTNVFQSNGVNNGATQDVLGTLKEIWPQVLEKAYAALNGSTTNLNSISNGGYPVLAMEAITGKSATWEAPSSATLAQLTALSAAGDMLVFDTKNASTAALGSNLVGGHAYMFDGIVGSGSGASIKLLNPWGTDQPSLIPVSSLSKGIAEIDIGHT